MNSKLSLTCSILLFGFLTGQSSLTSPPPIEWTNTFGGSIGDYGVKLIQTPDSAYAFLQRSMSYAVGNDDFLLLRLDRYGNALWQETYGGPEGVMPRDILWTGDGYLVCGYDSNLGFDTVLVLFKTDTLGVKEWQISPGFGRQAQLSAVVPVGDSGWISTGRTQTSVGGVYIPYVVRVNSVGDTLWSYAPVAEPTNKGFFRGIVDLGDGTFLASGNRFASPILSFPHVARIDPTSGVIWAKDVCSTQVGIQAAALVPGNQSVVLGGSSGNQGILMGVDFNGDSLWSRVITASQSTVVMAVAPCHDGGFVACATVGSNSPDPDFHIRVVKYDSLIVEEWSLELDTNFIEVHASSIVQTWEGGFILCGYSDDSEADIDEDAYAAKIASPFPHLKAFSADGSNPALHLLTSAPEFIWSSIDPQSIGQISYEMQIHSDTSWVGPLFWETGQVASQDTSLFYTGPTMGLGELYYLRIRVFNGLKWSPWYQTKIRRNTPPSVPVQSYPIDSTVVETLQPTLWFANAADAEGDSLTYELGLTYGGVEGLWPFIQEEVDSTAYAVPGPLTENATYSWRVRSFDGYEYSDWSSSKYFIVNSLSEPPSVSICLFPPIISDSVSSSLSPKFEWSRSDDPDPFDSVHYRLLLSTDSLFQQVFVFDTIVDTSYQLGFSLDKFRPYWWKVLAIDSDANQTTSSNVLGFYAGGVWCCDGLTGNVNNDPAGNVSLTDLTVLVNYLFVTFQPLTCYGEANTNGDQNCDINLSDVTRLVNYLFVTFQPIANCVDFSACSQD